MRQLVLLVVTAPLLIPVVTWSGEREQDALALDHKRIQGSWSVVAYDQDGKPLPAEIIKKMSVTIQATRISIRPKMVAQRSLTLKDGKTQADVKFTLEEGKTDEADYRLDVAKKRKVIELLQDVGSGRTRKITGIYLLDEDRLTICLPLPDRNLPKKLPNGPKAGLVRIVLKKMTAVKTEPGGN